MTAKSQPRIADNPNLIPANSPEAYALWTRRVGVPLYSFTVQHCAWAYRCPHCGGLCLLEIVFDSENGGFFKPETCACGGRP